VGEKSSVRSTCDCDELCGELETLTVGEKSSVGSTCDCDEPCGELFVDRAASGIISHTLLMEHSGS
jgi:hypothetical protein